MNTAEAIDEVTIATADLARAAERRTRARNEYEVADDAYWAATKRLEATYKAVEEAVAADAKKLGR